MASSLSVVYWMVSSRALSSSWITTSYDAHLSRTYEYAGPSCAVQKMNARAPKWTKPHVRFSWLTPSPRSWNLLNEQHCSATCKHWHDNFGCIHRYGEWSSDRKFACQAVRCVPAVSEKEWTAGECTAMMAGGDPDLDLPTAALAIAAAAAAASSAAMEIRRRIDGSSGLGGVFSSPSKDFVGLCEAQLDVCSRILGEDVQLTVYVRTVESFGSGQLELRRIAACPVASAGPPDSGTLVLVSSSESALISSSVEEALVQHEVVELKERRSLVVPLARESFLVGLLVAERTPRGSSTAVGGRSSLPLKRPTRPVWPPSSGIGPRNRAPPAGPQSSGTPSTSGRGDFMQEGAPVDFVVGGAEAVFSAREKGAVVKIADALALACVMDQRALLLQRSSWQTGVHMDSLLEQVRAPLAALRTLGRMLRPQLPEGELSRDMVEDMLVQGDRMKEVVHQLQKALYPAQNGGSLLEYDEVEPAECFLDGGAQIRLGDRASGRLFYEEVQAGGGQAPRSLDALPPGMGSQNLLPAPLSAPRVVLRDEEQPMPPLALAPVLPAERTNCCNVGDVVGSLARVAADVAQSRQVAVRYRPPSLHDTALEAAIDANDLRQAVGCVLEHALKSVPIGGWVEVEGKEAPGGGVLVVVANNGPDINLRMQRKVLAPLGPNNGTRGEDEDKDSNGVRGLGRARDIVERTGGVLRVESPYITGAPVGSGGTRVHMWLPLPKQ